MDMKSCGEKYEYTGENLDLQSALLILFDEGLFFAADRVDEGIHHRVQTRSHDHRLQRDTLGKQMGIGNEVD